MSQIQHKLYFTNVFSVYIVKNKSDVFCLIMQALLGVLSVNSFESVF